MTDTPQITGSYYNSTSIEPMQLGNWGNAQFGNPQLGIQDLRIPNQFQIEQLIKNAQPFCSEPSKIMPSTTRRIVQVFIADPNENVPLEKSVLYRGEQKLTDATDTELFFEVPITDLLTKHNAVRVTLPDKEASRKAGKDILLEAVKIRDLKMVVVTVAQF